MSLATGPQWIGCLTATEIEPYLNLWPGTEALLQAATGLVHPRSTRSHSSMGTGRLGVIACELSLVVASRGYSLVVVCRLLNPVVSLVAEDGL